LGPEKLSFYTNIQSKEGGIGWISFIAKANYSAIMDF